MENMTSYLNSMDFTLSSPGTENSMLQRFTKPADVAGGEDVATRGIC